MKQAENCLSGYLLAIKPLFLKTQNNFKGVEATGKNKKKVYECIFASVFTPRVKKLKRVLKGIEKAGKSIRNKCC